jgi:hypothetical protein
MTIDDVQELVAPVETLQERVANRRYLFPITEYSQHLGNRIISHFYPEHWAQVQLARDNARRYADG